MKTGEVIGRVVVACAGVSFSAVVGYALGATVLLSTEESARDAVLGLSLELGGLLVLASVIGPFAWIPLVHRVISSKATGATGPSDDDRARIYGLPGVVSALTMLSAAGVLGLGMVPLASAVSSGARMAAATAGAAVLLLASIGVYPSVRLALRPLVASLPPTEGAQVRRPESLSLRTALAVGIPSGVVALVATLVVGAHVAAIAHAEEEKTARLFSRVLSAPRVAGEDGDVRRVMARVLAAGGVRITEGVSAPQVEVRRVEVPSPGWGIVIAAVLGTLGGMLGLRIGQRASRQLEASARRMELVELGEKPRGDVVIDLDGSIPEVRRLVAALDGVAETLAAMAADQRRALTARSEAAKIRAFVLAGVSHDLRGPLNSVLGFAGLLLSGVEGALTDAQRESLEALNRGGRDLLRLVDDLLDAARLDAGRMTLNPAVRTVGELVLTTRRALGERVPGAQADEVVLRTECPADTRVPLDVDRLGGAVGALLAFALVRPGRAGAVSARVKIDEGEGLSVVIHAAGTTPARETMAQWFEPFEVAPVGQRVPAGLGLAVSVARRVIELQGGRVRPDVAPEGGMTIVVALSLALDGRIGVVPSAG